MKRLFTTGMVLVFVMLMTTVAFADQKINPDADCDVCLKTSTSGVLDVDWNAPTVDGSATRDEVLEYHDGGFEGQIGCGGGCAFGVRFSVDAPIFLTGFTLYTQGDASTMGAIVSIYLDEAAGVGGPPSAPVGPGDGTAAWESDPMDLSSPDGSTTQFDVTVPDLVITSGDYYIVVWENDSGWMGIANDLQTNYIDRNWVTTGTWSTINDAVGGDPTLVGNFGISATYIFQDIEGSYMTVGPTNIDFGSIQIADGAVTDNVTIGNIGDTDYSVTAIDVTGDGYSTALAAPVTVPAGGSVTMDVTYTPSVAGAAFGTYTITSDADNATSATVNVAVMVFDGFPDYFIWNPSLSVSGGAFQDAFTELGHTSLSDPNLFMFGDPLAAGFDAVFVCLGMYGNGNLQLADGMAEVDALVAYAEAGYPIYMEGGDTWAFDDPTALHGFFGIEGLADGGSDLFTVVGETILAGMDFDYLGVNAWVDELAPAIPDAFPIQVNPDDGQFCGIANLSPGANTVGTSYEFGGLVDDAGRSTKTELLAEYLEFLAADYTDIFAPEISGVTTITYTMDEVGPYPIDASITDNVGVTAASIFYRNGGEFMEEPMTSDGGMLWSGDIPGQPVGSLVEYYIAAYDEAENEAFSPSDAPAHLYSFSVVSHLPPMYTDAESGLDGQVYVSWQAPGTEIMAVNIEIFTDAWSGETYWDLVAEDGTYIDGILPGDLPTPETLYTWDLEDLVPGNYTFTIYDTFGDGICCTYGEGYYNLTVNGSLIATGGEFATEESTTFGPGGMLAMRQGRFDGHAIGPKGSAPSNIESLNIVEEIIIVNEITQERDLTGFVVYRDGVDVSGALGVDAGDYLDGYIPNGVEYCYTVEAVYDDGSAAAAPVCATPVNHNPAMPTGLQGVVDGLTITLDWDDNTEYDFDLYNIYREDAFLATSATSDYVDEVAIGGIYHYYVTAVDAEGAESEASEEVSMPAGNLPPMRLEAESGLDGTVNLEWAAPGDEMPGLLDCADELIDGLPFTTMGTNEGMGDDFDVNASDGEDYAFQLWMPSDGTITVTLCSEASDYDTKLEIFNEDCFTTTTYYNDDNTCDYGGLLSTIEGAFLSEGIYLIVVDGFGGGTGNFEITVTESAARSEYVAQDPAYEIEKLATAGIELQPWEMSSAPHRIVNLREQTGYMVYRDGAAVSGELPVGTLTYTDQYIPNGVEYCYVVEAVYDDGNSASNESCATPMNHAPAAPMNLQASVDDHDVTLTWDANTDYDLAEYNVYRDEVLVATQTETTFTEYVEASGVYPYYVTAVDAEDAESASSDVLQVPVGNLPPTRLDAESGLDGQVLLTWAAPGEVVSMLTIEVFTDTWSGETSWTLTNSSGELVASIAGGDLSPDTYYSWDYELDPDVYTFTIYDSFGDGICCAYGEGYYNLILNGTTIATGGEFATEESWTFDGSGIVLARTASRYIGSPVGPKGGLPLNYAQLEQVTDNIEVPEVTREERTLDGFEVYRDGVLVSETLTTDTYSYLDGWNVGEDLDNGTEYCYTVAAVYTDETTHSDEACATPVNHAPSVPQNVMASVDDATSELTLSWDDAPDYDLSGYNVYMDDVFHAFVSVSEMVEIMEDGNFGFRVKTLDEGGLESDESSNVQVIIGEAPPENLTVDGNFDDHVELNWREPGGGEEIPLVFDDGVLGNAFYFYDIFENGFAHGMRFDPVETYDVLSASVKILSEGDEYWPWPNDTHGPVRVIILSDEGGFPGEVLFDEEATAEDGWATVYPDLSGLSGSFYVISSHWEDWSTAGDPEGYGIDGAVDYPDNMVTLSDAVWSYGDVLGYGGDYMMRATIFGQAAARTLSHNDPTGTKEQLITMREHTAATMGAGLASSAGFIPTPSDPVIDRSQFTLREGERDIVNFNVYSDGELVGTPTETTFDHPVLEDEMHFYEVTATYSNGEDSGPSNMVEASANMGPGAPTNVSGMVTGHIVSIEWEDPTINMDGSECVDLEGVQILRDGVVVGDVDIWEWAFVDAGVSDGPHHYELVGYDEVPNYGIPAEFDVWVGPAPYVLQIFTDGWPGETSWDIQNSAGTVVASIFAGDLTTAGTLYEWLLELEPGDYTFNIYDAFGDGICCAYGEGYYQIVHGEEIVVGPGGEFADFESVPFTVEDALLMGDLNGDGVLDILDITRLIEIVTDTGEDVTPDELAVLDLNGDGAYNVLDVVILIEFVLDMPGLAKDAPVVEGVSVIVEPVSLTNNREWQNIPVHVTYEGMISGFQADLVFDPTVVELGVPVLSEGNESVAVYTSLSDNALRVLAIDLTGGQIDLATGLLMDVPVQIIDEDATGATDFEVEGLILSGPGGIEIECEALVSIIDIGLPAPTEFSLLQNYPNPFNPTTNIRYDIAEAGNVNLVIYNMLGQRVRTLVTGRQDVGRYEVMWNGLDDAGQPIATGVYIYHIQAGDYSKTYKMAFIK